jgi:hypothetical protein
MPAKSGQKSMPREIPLTNRDLIRTLTSEMMTLNKLVRQMNKDLVDISEEVKVLRQKRIEDEQLRNKGWFY